MAKRIDDYEALVRTYESGRYLIQPATHLRLPLCLRRIESMAHDIQHALAAVARHAKANGLKRYHIEVQP